MKNMHYTYDRIIDSCLTNISQLSKDSHYIILKNFDRKNKNHLFFFELAKIHRILYNTSIKINCSLFDYLIMKIKYRKFDFSRSKTNYGLDIDEILEFVRIGYEQPIKIFKDIYECYYERRKNV